MEKGHREKIHQVVYVIVLADVWFISRKPLPPSGTLVQNRQEDGPRTQERDWGPGRRIVLIVTEILCVYTKLYEEEEGASRITIKAGSHNYY